MLGQRPGCASSSSPPHLVTQFMDVDLSASHGLPHLATAERACASEEEKGNKRTYLDALCGKQPDGGSDHGYSTRCVGAQFIQTSPAHLESARARKIRLRQAL